MIQRNAIILRWASFLFRRTKELSIVRSSKHLSLLLLFSLGAILPVVISAQERESIFDRVIYTEDSVTTQIPRTPRLEEALGLAGRMVNVGNAEIYFEEEGAGVPLVLLHGGPGGTHHTFHPWFGRAAGFSHVIYYDQRGCGLSDYFPGPNGYSVHQAAEDLEALRIALELDSFVLVGFSYGGFLAQLYTTLYPENVAGLVLVGAGPGIEVDWANSRQQEFVSSRERASMRAARRELDVLAEDRGWTTADKRELLTFNFLINGDWKRQHYYKPTPARMAQIALYEWVQDPNFNPLMSQSMLEVDLSGAFETNPISTLILEGEWDLTWGHEKRAALASNHPNGKLVTFEHAGHSIFNEDPDGFFTTLREFVQGLPSIDPEELGLH